MAHNRFVALAAFIIAFSTARSTICAAQDAKHDDFDNYFCVDFVGSSTGWAVGSRAAIIHTQDGGATWTTQHRQGGRNPSPTLLSVSFADASTGIAVGSHGTILRTEDGGSSWRPAARVLIPKQDLPGSTQKAPESAQKEFYPPEALANLVFFKVMFASPKSAWLLGNNGILRSTDGGATWSIEYVGSSANLFGLHFVDEDFGVAVGEDGAVIRTFDGGKTWQQSQMEDTWRLNDVYFANKKTGWAAGEQGVIVRTDDGGETWRLQKTPVRASILKINFTKSGQGFAVSAQGPIITFDGESWVKVSMPKYKMPAKWPFGEANFIPLAFHLTDNGYGYLVGAGGLVLKSTDSGRTWEYLRSTHMAAAEEYLQKKMPRGSTGRADFFFGFVHPVGSLPSYTGPGALVEIDYTTFLGKRSEIGLEALFGGATTEADMDLFQQIAGEQVFGTIDSDVAIVTLGFLARWMLLERANLLLTSGIIVAPFFNRVMVDNKKYDVNYKGYRLGMALGQEFVFSYVFIFFERPDLGIFSKWGVDLKVQIYEGLTWGVSGRGAEDTGKGWELWPSVSLGITIFNGGSKLYHQVSK